MGEQFSNFLLLQILRKTKQKNLGNTFSFYCFQWIFFFFDVFGCILQLSSVGMKIGRCSYWLSRIHSGASLGSCLTKTICGWVSYQRWGGYWAWSRSSTQSSGIIFSGSIKCRCFVWCGTVKNLAKNKIIFCAKYSLIRLITCYSNF